MKQQLLNIELGQTITIENTSEEQRNKIRTTCSNIFKQTGRKYKVNKSRNDTIVTHIEHRDYIKSELMYMEIGESVNFSMKHYDTLRTYAPKYGISVRQVVEVTKVK